MLSGYRRLLPKPNIVSTFTGTNQTTLTITGGSYGVDQGITFLSDMDHYLLDFGTAPDRNRLSIFKDVSGYMNFRVIDRNGLTYAISADVSNWKHNDIHQVAASWKLNNINGRDEMHLFLDGFEVPNILK